jgi:glycosyltransferase involved in cell wall biosynthesis
VASHRRQADDVAEHLRYRGEVLVVPQWCYEDEAALLALAPPAADGPLRIGALCRFDRVKGLDVLVDAVTAAVGRGADCRLVLGGSGDEAEDLRRRGADLAAAGRLELAGHVRDRVAFLGGVDVAVVSSRAESGPIAGVEAMAAGRAIVSTPVGAMPERLEHGRSGLFFDVEDVDGLVGHLVELTADRALVQRLGEAARADYVERFRSELQEERLVGALADLAGRRRVSS